MEHAIRRGKGKVWAIDVNQTIPVLQTLRASRNRGKIIVSTETNYADEIQKLYLADEISNKEDLEVVVARLSNCRCLFVGGGTSFAAAIVAIVNPTYIVYMVDAPDFRFHRPGYHYEEFGEKAISIRARHSEIVRRCSITHYFD